MTLNVNTNSAALQALATLNQVTQNLATTNEQISSQLKVSSAKDNAAVYAVAQTQRADIQALSVVTDGLNRAQSVADVAVSAGQTISDLLSTLRNSALSASDPSTSTADRATYNADFQSTLQRITQTIQSASFNGVNLLNGSLTHGVSFMATADASSNLTLSGSNLSLGGTTITVPSSADISTVTNASAVLSLVESSITNVNSAVADLGSQSTQVTSHASFVSLLSDSLTTGVGHLVDADVAADSARLQALQVQQSLATQSLSIANQSPSVLLSLFKS